ncbi:DUF3343 domain-containing protein [Bacillota bacterium LX-D]|nr:DUF3343 domain-containing protein [Bacillota bacterium LX-D]
MAYCVATFHSYYTALRFEKSLKFFGIAVRLVPVPRKISSSCGVSAKFPVELKEKVISLAANQNLEYDKIYILDE